MMGGILNRIILVGLAIVTVFVSVCLFNFIDEQLIKSTEFRLDLSNSAQITETVAYRLTANNLDLNLAGEVNFTTITFRGSEPEIIKRNLGVNCVYSFRTLLKNQIVASTIGNAHLYLCPRTKNTQVLLI